MNQNQLDDAKAPRSVDQQQVCVKLAVKLVQLYLHCLPGGDLKVVNGFHRACYEFLPHMELEIVPRMIFESVTRTEFFAECERQGLGIGPTLESEFQSVLNDLRYTTTRWFAEPNAERSGPAAQDSANTTA